MNITSIANTFLPSEYNFPSSTNSGPDSSPQISQIARKALVISPREAAKSLAVYSFFRMLVPTEAVEEGTFAITSSVATVTVGLFASIFTVLSYVGARQTQKRNARTNVIADRENDIQEISAICINQEGNAPCVKGKLLFYRQSQRLLTTIAEYEYFEKNTPIRGRITGKIPNYHVRIKEIEKYIRILFYSVGRNAEAQSRNSSFSNLNLSNRIIDAERLELEMRKVFDDFSVDDKERVITYLSRVLLVPEAKDSDPEGATFDALIGDYLKNQVGIIPRKPSSSH